MLLRPGRARWWILLGICAAAIAWLVIGGLASNIVYFRTASEAEADRAHDATHVFRLAGAVVPNSVQAVADGVDFQLTDGHATIARRHLANHVLEHVLAGSREHFQKRRNRANAVAVTKLDLLRRVRFGDFAGRRVDPQSFRWNDLAMAERLIDRQFVIFQRFGRRAQPCNGQRREDSDFEDFHRTAAFNRLASVRTLPAAA